MFVELLCFSLLTITISYLDVNENGCLLSTTTEKMFSSPLHLRNSVECFLNELKDVEDTDLLLGNAGDIKSDLLEVMSENYTIYPFGSRVMGLGLKTSDVDLFIDVGHCYNGGGDISPKIDCRNAVQTIAESMMSQNQSFYDIRLIPKARVPILKAIHRNTGIHVDISTRNAIGIQNSILIRGYLENPKVKFVGAAVKLWSRNQGLSKAVAGPEAISSYCMLWLVLFALMQDTPPIVTPVVDLKRQYKGPELIIDGWDCGFCRSVHPSSKNNKSEFELLYYFFDFYSRMSVKDIKESVICPFTGTLIQKRLFLDTLSLPNEFDNYKQQLLNDKKSELMYCNTSMCVQDPVEQNNNIAKTVRDWAIVRFLESCRSTAKIMKRIMHEDLNNLKTGG